MWKRRKKKQPKPLIKRPQPEANGELDEWDRKAVRWKKILGYWLMFLTLLAAAVKGSFDIVTELARYIVSRWHDLWP